MELSQQYRLVSQAKRKLTREARRIDPDLRVLVTHANVLDNLVEDIHKTQQEKNDSSQLSVKFDLSPKSTNNAPPAPSAVHFNEDEDDEDYYSSSDDEDDSDSDYYDSDEEEDDENYVVETATKSCWQLPILEEDDMNNNSSELPHLTFSDSEEEESDSSEEDGSDLSAVHGMPISASSQKRGSEKHYLENQLDTTPAATPAAVA